MGTRGRRAPLPRSFLGVPILLGDEAIGAISVQSTTRKAASARRTSRLLTTLAANIGAAIQNARLYSESQRRATEMAALAEVGSRDLRDARAELRPAAHRRARR